MKIQAIAQIKYISIDGEQLDIPDSNTIDLEFSAIDTGGGFKDPILDFSFSLDSSLVSQEYKDQQHEFEIVLENKQEGREADFVYYGPLQQMDDGYLQANGRLKEDRLSRDLIGFVLQLLR